MDAALLVVLPCGSGSCLYSVWLEQIGSSLLPVSLCPPISSLATNSISPWPLPALGSKQQHCLWLALFANQPWAPRFVRIILLRWRHCLINQHLQASCTYLSLGISFHCKDVLLESVGLFFLKPVKEKPSICGRCKASVVGAPSSRMSRAVPRRMG